MTTLRKTHYRIQGYSITEQIRETWFTEDTPIENPKKLLTLTEGKKLLQEGYLLKELMTVYLIDADTLISLRKQEDKLNILNEDKQVFSTVKQGSCEVKFAEKRNLKDFNKNSIHWDITELFNTLTPQIF